MFAIYKKELRSYFMNAIGYVYVGVFLAASALLCCMTTLMMGSYDTSTYFIYLLFTFIILIPLLTMRLFSEEKKLRTEQLLLTAPVSITGMVLGKYFAALTMFLGALAVSCINFFPLYVYRRIEAADAQGSSIHMGPLGAQMFGCLIGVDLTVKGLSDIYLARIYGESFKKFNKFFRSSFSAIIFNIKSNNLIRCDTFGYEVSHE